MNLISFLLFLPSCLVGYYRLSVFFVLFTSSGLPSYNLVTFSCFFSFYPFLLGASLLKYKQLTVFPIRTVVSKRVNTVKVVVRNKIKSVL